MRVADRAAAPPQAIRPTAPQQGVRPTAPPQSARPTAPPQSARPTAPPQSARPTAPPQSARPTLPPQSARPTQPPKPKRPAGFPPGKRASPSRQAKPQQPQEERTPDSPPGRPPYALPGGPAASVDWARTVLGNLVTAHQVRTWNLSAVWRLDDARGNPVAWLKQVPEFFAHEAETIRLVSKLAPALVPYVIVAGEEGRILMRHVPGEDAYGAGPGLREHVLAAWHPVQAEFVRFLADEDRRQMIEATIPDGRLSAEHLTKVATPYLDTIDGLRELIDGLPERLAAVRECRIPDTIVHGDLHVGNVRADAAGRCTIIDWGDSFLGHPAFDLLRLVGDLDDPGPLTDQWAYRWKSTVPGSDPHRAVRLLRPVAALREAAVYAAFLDAIEPSEWPYHADDIPAALERAASMVDW
ncbi:phosphotransferase [Actinoplanes sp. TBRC 11911]|nr:phosphotransferase [Actinoplanes sp. TBRC 11911]